MIRLKCPSCAAALGLDDNLVGQSAFCPACGLIFAVPAPAVLLDPGDGAGKSPPRPSQPAGPLLPEGPIDLASEAHLPSPADLPFDPWRGVEPPAREIAAKPKPETIPLVDVFAPSSSTADSAAATSGTSSSAATIAPERKENVDWSFLMLEPSKEPADVPLEPIAELPEAMLAPAPEALPLALATEPEIAEAIPLDGEGEADIPEAIPMALPSALPVAEAIVVAPQAAAVPEALPVGVAAERLDISTPASAASQLEWSETPQIDIGPLPRWARKPKVTTKGVVSLIPGFDDYFLALIALGTLWLTLSIWILIVPKIFWLPLIIGGLVWVSGNFFFARAFEDVGNIARAVITILPLPGYPLFLVYGVKAALIYDLCALLFMALLAIPYMIRSPEWTVRPLSIACLGAGIVFTALFVAAAHESPGPLPPMNLDDRLLPAPGPDFQPPPPPPDPDDPPP